ncbi:MAG: DNA alkylation repair protein [Proteobacteria bacterium]|nr:DNA alkylation repair protein [Pseudomonadota bacterium]
MTTPQSALAALQAQADPQKADEMTRQHKVERPYLGVSNPQIDALYKGWRLDTDTGQRVAIAAYLWDSNIHEARIAAAKLLTQARINPDAAVWDEIQRWVPDFDATAIADHACSAGGRRLTADPARLDAVEEWVTHENMWVRRAALVMTLPWTKLNHPTDSDMAARERVLGWAAIYVDDPEWFIQNAVVGWLRSLSKHDLPRVQTFVAQHGAQMKPFAYKEVSKYI